MLAAYWYGGAAAWPTGAKLRAHLATLKRHGIGAYLPQFALNEARLYILKNDVKRYCDEAGITLYLGLGLDRGRSSPSDTAHERAVTKAIIDAEELREAGTVARVSLNWESYWNGRTNAVNRIADAVLAAVPSTPEFTEDPPWWAPLFYIDANGRKRPTHPSAPTTAFGRLVDARFVQAYVSGKEANADGVPLARLKWSRSPSQYASLGTWPIHPTTQLYARSLNDVIKTTLTEPLQRLWTWNEASTTAKKALRVVAELATKGFTGANAVREFQTASRITVDGIVGPQTLHALGLGPKP